MLLRPRIMGRAEMDAVCSAVWRRTQSSSGAWGRACGRGAVGSQDGFEDAREWDDDPPSLGLVNHDAHCPACCLRVQTQQQTTEIGIISCRSYGLGGTIERSTEDSFIALPGALDNGSYPRRDILGVHWKARKFLGIFIPLLESVYVKALVSLFNIGLSRTLNVMIFTWYLFTNSPPNCCLNL